MTALSSLIVGFLNILRGMSVTLANFGAPKVTVQYPRQRRRVSPRYRGMFYLKWNPEKERLNCVGCTLCAQACPTDVITMHKVGKGTDAGVDEFTMDLGRCMFCELCVEACPFDAIYMGQEYEFATYQRDQCVVTIDALAQGGSANVRLNNETLERLRREAEQKRAAKGEGHDAESKD